MKTKGNTGIICSACTNECRASVWPNSNRHEAGTLTPFQLIFCDPPYGKGLGERALAEAVNRGWAEQGAVAVLEERADAEVGWPAPFHEIDRRRYRDTQIAIARVGIKSYFRP